MDITERKKQYYIDNKERIKEKALKYYYDNKEKRIVYNKGYWDLHKHKYLKQRSEDIIYKTNQRLYYQSYKENKKHIYTVDCIDLNLQDIKLQDLDYIDKKPLENITVIFKFSF